MIRAIALFAGLLLVGLFALLNWPAFMATTELSLGVTTVQAPLGLLMLGAVVFISVLFTVWAISLQASALVEGRRQTKELQAQRELADRAEASRFTELRAVLMAEIKDLIHAQNETRSQLTQRMDLLQDASHARLEETANTFAAHMGALEDRLEHADLLPRQRAREAAFAGG